MQITNRNTHTAWAAKVDELLELYLAIRGDELLKRRDFVPQLLLLLHCACTKYIITKKKEKNIQNTERSGDASGSSYVVFLPILQEKFKKLKQE